MAKRPAVMSRLILASAFAAAGLASACSAVSTPPAAPASSSSSSTISAPRAAPPAPATGAAALAASAAPPVSPPSPLPPPRRARVLWTREPVDNTDFYRLALSPGQPLLLLGDNRTFVTSPDDMFVEAIGADGEAVWHKSGTAKWTRGIVATPQHAFISTEFGGDLAYEGVKAHAAGTAAFLAKLGPDGALAWGRVLETPSFTRVQSLAATPDGGVGLALGLFAAPARGPLAVKMAGGQDTVIVKYDASGEVVWTRAFGWPGYDEATALFALPDGDMIVTGTRWKSPDTWQFALADGRCHGWAARIGAAGEPRWSVDLGSDTMRVTAQRAARAPRGMVVSGVVRYRNKLGGFELDGGPRDRGYLAALDDDGKVLWARLHEVPECIAVDREDRLVLAGKDGITIETAGGESTEVLAFPRDTVTRIHDCQLDDAGHLYVTGAARPGAKIGERTLAGPVIKRPRTSWLKPYEVGFVAKLAL